MIRASALRTESPGARLLGTEHWADSVPFCFSVKIVTVNQADESQGTRAEMTALRSAVIALMTPHDSH